MLRKILPAFLLLILFSLRGKSQACSTLGQTPATAFPVCPVDVYHQTSVPTCINNSIPVPCGDNVPYADANPYWYKFTCYVSGTLGFTITPENLEDDYDWQVFDVTGHNPNDIYTDPSLFVVGNWSGNTALEASRGYTGITGTSTTGQNIIECASNPQELGGNPPFNDASTFSSMPMITIGHNYLLMISHYSGTNQSGYDLSFNGGNAIITDFVQPALVSATADCAAEVFTIRLNKKVKCSTLAANGSDFKLSPKVANVIAASGINCNNSFDMDSLTITIDRPLPPGNYSIVAKLGNDNNTLLDNCDLDMPVDDSIAFTINPLAPTPMDSITPVLCAPDTLQLVFKKRMRCNSIAANGSDFVFNGEAGVSVVGAFGDNCSNGVSNIIKVKLNKPVQVAGIKTLSLKIGSDGNTILDECAQETPAGSFINFITVDTVSADFSYSLHLGCVYDTLFYAHNGRNNVNTWNWAFDSNGISNTRDSFFSFNDYGSKLISLNVSNGVCTDSSSASVLLDNELISRFVVLPSTNLCPEDAVQYIDSSTGKIVSWFWTFGDGNISTLQTPSPKKYVFPSSRDGKLYPASLIIKNNIGCFDTSQAMIKVLYSCYVAVPSAFTPNGDGLNDYLYPVDAYKADNLEFRIYNRWGQLVFETKDWTKKWDGRINGNAQEAGTYVWMLRYTDHDTGKQVSLKGTTILIR